MRHETCAITGLPIYNKDKVVLMFLVEQEMAGFWNDTFMSSKQFFIPYPIVIKGTYRSFQYCSELVDIENDPLLVQTLTKEIGQLMKTFVHPHTKAEIKRGAENITINKLIDASEYSSLSVSYSEDSMYSRKLTHVYILREVYDEIMNERYNEKVNDFAEELWNGNFNINFNSVTYDGDDYQNNYQSFFYDNAMVLTPMIYNSILPFNNERYINHSVYSAKAVQEVCEAYIARNVLTYYLETIRRVWMVPERSWSRNKVMVNEIINHNEMVQRLTARLYDKRPIEDDDE